jgi:hypothetical protein
LTTIVTIVTVVTVTVAARLTIAAAAAVPATAAATTAAALLSAESILLFSLSRKFSRVSVSLSAVTVAIPVSLTLARAEISASRQSAARRQQRPFVLIAAYVLRAGARFAAAAIAATVAARCGAAESADASRRSFLRCRVGADENVSQHVADRGGPLCDHLELHHKFKRINRAAVSALCDCAGQRRVHCEWLRSCAGRRRRLRQHG